MLVGGGGRSLAVVGWAVVMGRQRGGRRAYKSDENSYARERRRAF